MRQNKCANIFLSSFSLDWGLTSARAGQNLSISCIQAKVLALASHTKGRPEYWDTIVG